MKDSIKSSLFVLGSLLTASLAAQPMSVIGGNEKAQECFMNAEMAAKKMPGISRSMLEPCNYSLEFSDLNLRDQAATFANRGIVYAALQDYGTAMKDYDVAVAMKPSAPEVYVNRGNAFFMMRDYAMALEDYETSMNLGIKQIHFVHYNMGMVFEMLGNDATAVSNYEMALAIDPNWMMPQNRLQVVRQRMEAAQKEAQKATNRN